MIVGTKISLFETGRNKTSVVAAIDVFFTGFDLRVLASGFWLVGFWCFVENNNIKYHLFNSINITFLLLFVAVIIPVITVVAKVR